MNKLKKSIKSFDPKKQEIIYQLLDSDDTFITEYSVVLKVDTLF